MRFVWCCLLGAMAVIGSPAAAADEIGLSNDGVSWGTSLSLPLYDPAQRWVPGDDETASFYVRNQGPTRALLTIEARSADTDRLLSDDDIRLRARAGGGSWIRLDNGVPTAGLTDQTIARGGVVKVDVNAAFDWDAPNRSQAKELEVVFRVVLSDALDDSGGRDRGSLPGTGSMVPGWGIVAGAALIAVGAGLTRRRRAGERT